MQNCRIDRSKCKVNRIHRSRGHETNRSHNCFFRLDPSEVELWIKTVIYNYHWTPDYISGLFLDDLDLFGLEWHYNTIKGVDNDIKKQFEILRQKNKH